MPTRTTSRPNTRKLTMTHWRANVRSTVTFEKMVRHEGRVGSYFLTCVEADARGQALSGSAWLPDGIDSATCSCLEGRGKESDGSMSCGTRSLPRGRLQSCVDEANSNTFFEDPVVGRSAVLSLSLSRCVSELISELSANSSRFATVGKS